MGLESRHLEDNGIVISSGDNLTIETAADFKRLLQEGLEVSQNVSIEFEPGVKIDITGLQLLCSACRTAAAKGKIFSCQGPHPQSLEEIIETCGARRQAICKLNMNSNCQWFGGL